MKPFRGTTGCVWRRRYAAVAGVLAVLGATGAARAGAARAGTAEPAPLQAEQATLTGARVLNAHAGYTGSGYVLIKGEGGLAWSYDAATAGLYQLAFRYALARGEKPVSVRAGFVGSEPELTFPATGGWDRWALITTFIRLEAGANTIELRGTGRGGPLLDSVLVSFTPPDESRFLTFPWRSSHGSFRGSAGNADAYYDTIDPTGAKTTFDAWRSLNGFDSGVVLNATYLNNVDLNFGRDMYVKELPDGSVASYVQNYPTLTDAVDGTGLLATVAMEFRAPVDAAGDPLGRPPITTFYVFDGDGQRVNRIDLDGRGEKYVPGLCNVCHGGKPKDLRDDDGRYLDDGDTGAKWIPWDLDTYRFHPSRTRASQEAAFKAMNRVILSTFPTVTTRGLVHGWYGGAGMPNSAFDGGYLPSGWTGKPALYREVVAPSCRACHAQRGTYHNAGGFFQGEALQTSLEFNSFGAFEGYRDQIEDLVYDQGVMPLALRTYQLFWRSDQPKVLDDELFGGLAHQNPPNAVYGFNDRQAFGALRKPGRPIIRIDGTRPFLGTLTFEDARDQFQVRLNAGPSVFTETYSWSFRGDHGDAEISRSGSSLAYFQPDPAFDSDIKSAGSTPYRVRLVAGNRWSSRFGGYNDFFESALFTDSALQPVNFVDDIFPLLSQNLPHSGGGQSGELSCFHCHSNSVVGRAHRIFNLRYLSDAPGPSEQAFAFESFMTRVDCNDAANSLIVRKPGGHFHYGGRLSGFGDGAVSGGTGTGDDNYRLLIERWIREGARYDGSAGSRFGCPLFRIVIPPIVIPPIIIQPVDPLAPLAPLAARAGREGSP